MSRVLNYAKQSSSIQNEYSKCCFHSVAKLDVHKPPSSPSAESKGFMIQVMPGYHFVKEKKRKKKNTRCQIIDDSSILKKRQPIKLSAM
jgi:hypothetical protein